MPKIDIASVAERRGSSYPKPFDEPCRGRIQQRLGDACGLTQYGINLVTLEPGAWSSQRHWHTKQDEFVWILDGEVVIVSDDGEETLRAGDCIGWPGGPRNGHHAQNRSSKPARLLVVGTRLPDDAGEYSDLDMTFGPDGFRHKDGRKY